MIGRKGMLGLFIIPFFIISLFLGFLGLILFFYVSIKNIVSKYLYTKYSISVGSAILTLNDFYITPSFLNYLGIIMFFLGLLYLLLILKVLNEKIFIKENILNIPFYLIVYLMIYPFVLVDSVWNLWFGKKSWR
jgi:hypothetical protein